MIKNDNIITNIIKMDSPKILSIPRRAALIPGGILPIEILTEILSYIDYFEHDLIHLRKKNTAFFFNEYLTIKHNNYDFIITTVKQQKCNSDVHKCNFNVLKIFFKYVNAFKFSTHVAFTNYANIYLQQHDYVNICYVRDLARISCKMGRIDILKILGNTVKLDAIILMKISCQNGHLEIVKYLIKLGVDVNDVNNVNNYVYYFLARSIRRGISKLPNI